MAARAASFAVARAASFAAAVSVGAAVGLVFVLRRLRALERRVLELTEVVQGQETSLQWLTQRMETRGGAADSSARQKAPAAEASGKPGNISRQDSWQSMNDETAGYKTAEEDFADESSREPGPPPASQQSSSASVARPAPASVPSSMPKSDSEADAGNKWACVSNSTDQLHTASVPPSPADPSAMRAPVDPDSAEALQQALQQALQKADERYDEQSFEEAHTLLTTQLEPARSQGPKLEAQVLWRLARICKDIGSVAGARGGAAGKTKERELLTEGMKHATAALDADDEHFATHKWYAIMVSLTSGFEGTKATIQKSFVCKLHFEKAIELNPSDATSRHLLGLWYYEVAGLSWTLRKVAAAIFAEPPTGTYAEAKEHFAAAETIEPGFYVKNRLMLGKCCLQLNDKVGASSWFEKALELPTSTVDDEQAITEARRLLNEAKRR